MQPGRQQRPWPVEAAGRLLLVLVLAGLVVSVLVVAFSDELDAAWSRGEPADSAIQPLDFTPVVLVLYVTIALLVLVLRTFLLRAHAWARHVLAVIVLGVAIATLAGMRTHVPGLFMGCAVASLVLDAALLVCLWHPLTGRFTRGEPVAGADRDDATAS